MKRNTCRVAPCHILFLLLFLIFISPRAHAADIVTGLVAHWKLDGNAGDYSGGGNNGTIVGATATADRFGIANAALSFNGTSSDYVDTSFDYSIQYNGKSTFTLWFKPFTINTSGKIKVLIGKVVPNYNISQLNAGIDIHQWDPSGQDAIRHYYTAVLTENNWHFLTFIYDGAQEKSYVYLNGQLKGTEDNMKSSFRNGSESTKIGKGFGWSGSSSPYFNGLIDDVRIYNRALTQDDVTALYNNGGPPRVRNAVIRGGVVR